MPDLASMTGMEQLQAMSDGLIPPAPIAETLGMVNFGGEEGSISVELVPERRHYNPLGTVHGGVLFTLLDTAAACSVHSTLAPGEGYTSLRPDREVPAARHRGVGPAPGGRACGVARSAYGAGRGPAGRRGGQAGRPRDVELHDLRGLRFATGKRA